MTPILGIIASSVTSAIGDFDSIASTTVGSGGTATVTFSNIPSTYRHLQIRGIARAANNNAGVQIMVMSLNSDTNSSNYAKHNLSSNGTALSAGGGVDDRGFDGLVNANFTANVFNGFVIDILDYANTNKNKNIRMLNGFDSNGDGRMYLSSNLWANTSAITSISFTVVVSGNYVQHSAFALYGIR